MKEGIRLDPELIVKNPGRKATAKLMLNSFRGKFGENLHKRTTEAVTTPAHLFSVVSDTMFNIHAVRICSEDLLEVDYSHLSENQPDNGRINIFLAAFTTCWARLKLQLVPKIMVTKPRMTRCVVTYVLLLSM